MSTPYRIGVPVLPLVTVGLDDDTATVLSENPSPHDGQAYHHFTTAEQALAGLGDLAADQASGVEADPDTGEYRVHVAYGLKTLGLAASNPKSVRLPVTGWRFLVGAVRVPEHKPRRVVDGTVMGEDDDTLWIQGAHALHVHALINVHMVGTRFLWDQLRRTPDGP